MRKQFLKLRGKTLVIIDWANVYGWFKDLKWEIKPKRLFEYLKSYPEITDIRFYFGLEKGNEKSIKFQRLIKKIGYLLISKEVKWVPVSLKKSHFRNFISKLTKISKDLKINNNQASKAIDSLLKTPIYRRKCDFDCEITLDIIKNIDNFESLILFSGDGDYAVVVEELIKRKKQVIVIFAKGHKGKEYQDFKKGLFLCSVERLRSFLK